MGRLHFKVQSNPKTSILFYNDAQHCKRLLLYRNKIILPIIGACYQSLQITDKKRKNAQPVRCFYIYLLYWAIFTHCLSIASSSDNHYPLIGDSKQHRLFYLKENFFVSEWRVGKVPEWPADICQSGERLQNWSTTRTAADDSGKQDLQGSWEAVEGRNWKVEGWVFRHVFILIFFVACYLWHVLEVVIGIQIFGNSVSDKSFMAVVIWFD